MITKTGGILILSAIFINIIIKIYRISKKKKKNNKIISFDNLLAKLEKYGKVATHIIKSEKHNVFSKLGGLPEMQKNQEWPLYDNEPLHFLLQIKLSEIKLSKDYPQKGILYFFYQDRSTRGFSPDDKGSRKVIYLEDENKKLETKEKPKELKKVFKEKRIKGSNIKTYPIFDDFPDHINLDANQESEYFEFVESRYKDKPKHIIGGNYFSIQGSNIELESEMVTNGYYLGEGYPKDDEKMKEMKEKSKDRKLLMQIDSDDETNMMRGDSGILYFLIKEEDLKKKKFENVRMILQCY